MHQHDVISVWRNLALYNEFRSCESITAARTDYAKMIAINADLDESKNAKNHLNQIVALLVGGIRRRQRLGGLLTYYYRAA